MRGLWIYLICILVNTGLVITYRLLRKRARKLYADCDVGEASGKRTGKRFAEELLAENGVEAGVQPVVGQISDNFIPNKPKVRINVHICKTCSVLGLAVAAHDVAHVLQYLEHPTAVRTWRFFHKVTSWTPLVGILILLIVIPFWILGTSGAGGMMIAGFLLYIAPLVFHLSTLSVQYRANRRAERMLIQDGRLSAAELGTANRVLQSLAFQHVLQAMQVMSISPWHTWLKAASMRRKWYFWMSDYYGEYQELYEEYLGQESIY